LLASPTVKDQERGAGTDALGNNGVDLRYAVIRHNHVGIELGRNPFIPVMETAELREFDNPSSA
jgi:hypothetical protein